MTLDRTRSIALVGVDAGATKTEAVTFESASGRCSFAVGGPANPSVVGLERAGEVVATTALSSLSSAGLDPSQLDLVAVSAAGIVDRDSAEALGKVVARRLGCPPSRVLVFEDVVAAHASVFLLGDGVVGILGTGSCVYGVSGPAVVRVGGWGHLLGDEGSAFRLGVRALREVLECFEGLRGCSSLASKVIGSRGFRSSADVLSYVYRSENPKVAVASLAGLVMESYREGDAAAKRVVELEMREFARQVAAAVRRLGTGRARVGFTGSVYAENKDVLRPLLVEYLEEYLGSVVEVVEQKVKACCGSIIAGLRATSGIASDVVVVLERCCRPPGLDEKVKR